MGMLLYAIRMLMKTPGFTLVAIITLALGIGINTAVFTLYESVALKPLPIRSPAELVRVTGQLEGREIDQFSYSEYGQLREQSHSFASLVATSMPQTVVCAFQREAEVARARLVSANYFEALGITPALGRPFTAGEESVAVVSHPFWKRTLNEDRAVVGKAIFVQGAPLTIIGVAPETFAGTGLPPQTPDLWIPLSMQTAILPGVDWIHEPSAREWQILARRKPGITVEQASAELGVLGSAWPPVNDQHVHLSAKKATFFQTDSGEFQVFGSISVMLAVAVALILLIGCVNLVNLFLARNAAREIEIAVRLAMGASRPQLVRQLCTESVLLGVVGGAAGLVLSIWACNWIRLWIMETLPRISGGALSVFLDFQPDWQVLAYTAGVSLLTGIAAGVWPAVHATRMDVNAALKRGTAGTAPAGRGWNKRNFLLSAQVAACLMLLAGAGLLFRGVWRSQSTDPGFDVKHVFMMGIDPKVLAQTPAGRTAILRRAIGRVQDIPEVESIAWADRPPFLGHGTGPFLNEKGAHVQCLFNAVSDRYFETLGIPLLAGRNFTAGEIERRDAVAIISESAARQFWPGADPIGRRISANQWLKQELGGNAFTVIGVVKSVRSTYLSKVDEAFVYLPKPLSATYGWMLVRTRATPEIVFHALFSELAAIHTNLPSQTNLVTLEQGPVQIQRLMAEAPAFVASTLGLLALILASVGIYGLVSYLVMQRTREIGIRIALGAQNGDVIRMVLGQTLRPVLWGAAIGLAGALGLSSLLAALIVFPDVPDLTYGAGAFHPATFAGVLAVLLTVVAVASFVPVRRATRVEPIAALRNE